MRPLRILLVDRSDEDAGLSAELQGEGHTVALCPDGPCALARARELHPDAVLVRTDLPGVDGYALARALRALHSGEDATYVALSDSSQSHDKVIARGAGFDHQLERPVRWRPYAGCWRRRRWTDLAHSVRIRSGLLSGGARGRDLDELFGARERLTAHLHLVLLRGGNTPRCKCNRQQAYQDQGLDRQRQQGKAQQSGAQQDFLISRYGFHCFLEPVAVAVCT